MNKMTQKQYEKHLADCEGLCVISEEMLETDPDLMKCVRCPFCLRTVDAILTETHIICPECNSSAKKVK